MVLHYYPTYYQLTCFSKQYKPGRSPPPNCIFQGGCLAFYSGTHNIQCTPFGYGTILLSYILSTNVFLKTIQAWAVAPTQLHFPGRKFTLWPAVLWHHTLVYQKQKCNIHSFCSKEAEVFSKLCLHLPVSKPRRPRYEGWQRETGKGIRVEKASTYTNKHVHSSLYI